MQNRFKSKALWVSVAASLWVIASVFHIPERIGLTEDMYTKVLDAVSVILIEFGILNNPTDKENF